MNEIHSASLKKKKGPVNCIYRLTSEIERRLLKSEFQVQIAALCEGFHEGWYVFTCTSKTRPHVLKVEASHFWLLWIVCVIVVWVSHFVRFEAFEGWDANVSLLYLAYFTRSAWEDFWIRQTFREGTDMDLWNAAGACDIEKRVCTFSLGYYVRWVLSSAAKRSASGDVGHLVIVTEGSAVL